MGLLNKANNLLTKEDEIVTTGDSKNQNDETTTVAPEVFHQNKLFAFSDFINKYKIQTFAILESIGNCFTVKDSLGLDGNTIAKFAVTFEDFNTIFKNHQNIATVNKNDFDFIAKSFGSMQDLCEKLSFCKISNNYIMLCDCEISEPMLDDFQRIDNTSKLDYDYIYQSFLENENSCVVKIDFGEAIETFVCTNASKQLSKRFVLNSIYAEICNRFLFWYSSPLFCRQSSDYSLKLFLPAQMDLPEELLLTHIIYNLKDILDNCAEIINIEISKINQKEDIQIFFES